MVRESNDDESSGSALPMVVGLGASAGGLEALQQFFGAMSSTSGLSFVVVQHLSPDYKSLLDEILSKSTRMPVVQVEDEMDVVPDHVYLIPPKSNLVLRKNKLYLTEYVHSGINHPIDLFFTSLAESMKERAIAVVLSGTGSDGTSGIKVVKEFGGLVIAQDPDSAKFDGMPKSAISTGLADFILSPPGIAEEILKYTSYPFVSQAEKMPDLFSDEDTLSRIYFVLKKACGIDFTHYKRSTVARRIERRMVVTHREDPRSYLELLVANEDEAQMLGKEILIGVTSFFRDGSFFEKLKEVAISKLVKHSSESEPIRVWVAGCSTGEEAYSIAILFSEVMEELQIVRDIKIFATDVDSRAIEIASKGTFSEGVIGSISPERLVKFFSKVNGHYQISKEIRRMVIFAPHNMFQDPPFGRLELISCRNVLIYFQPVLQKALFGAFHSALKEGGYLFLGKSETAGGYGDVFKPVSLPEKIYLHVSTGRMSDIIPMNYATPEFSGLPIDERKAVIDEKTARTMEDVYCRFLEHHLPPTVVLDEKNDVIHFFGAYEEFLHIGKGKASFQIFSLMDDDLSLVVSTGLNTCRNEKTDITYTDVVVQGVSGQHVIDLIIQPVFSKRGIDTGLIAIIFNEHRLLEPLGRVEQFDVNKTAAQRIVDLERELLDTQENLKSVVSELETVNEELQAANEELLTANEELQSSNEELQSVNEELYTVNSEYQHKLDELNEMTNDLSNFLSSTLIGIVFVDNGLSIRKFTDYIGREFKLMEQDVGRPLQILSHCFPQEDIVHDAEEVLRLLIPLDCEVVSDQNKRYTMRIVPYRTTDNGIKGLVFTIIDSFGSSTVL